MIERMIFSLQESIKYRARLKTLPYEKDIVVINWQALWDAGIRVVVLDFDGVLAADKQQEIQTDVFPILQTIYKIFGNHVYIFSNQPTPQRQAYFALHFPWIQFLVAKQKPYPDGLLNIITREEVKANEIILIDDRLLTGGLAAILAGIKCIIIEKPFISFQDNWLREMLFISIRAVERLLFW